MPRDRMTRADRESLKGLIGRYGAKLIASEIAAKAKPRGRPKLHFKRRLLIDLFRWSLIEFMLRNKFRGRGVEPAAKELGARQATTLRTSHRRIEKIRNMDSQFKGESEIFLLKCLSEPQVIMGIYSRLHP